MARKFVLVPEDMYQSFLASNQSLGDTARLADIKREADQALISKNSTPSKRRVAYEKKLRDFLKLRREIVEKPIKVAVEKKEAEFKPFSLPARIGKRQARQAPPKRPTKSPEQPRLENEENAATPPRTEQQQQVPETPHRPETARRQELDAERERRQKALEERANAVYEYVSKDPAKFGITPEGQIIGNKNKLIENSNVRDAVNRILAKNTVGSSPPGTTIFRSRLLQDENIKRIINPSTQSGQGSRTSFRPQLWKHS